MALLSLLFVAQVLALEKNISAGVHGSKMIVEHVQLDSGKHLLRVRQVAVNGVKQNVELKLAKHELLAGESLFRCENDRGELVYAVISKKQAKESVLFPAERAWAINEDKLSLERIPAIRKVKCFFTQPGEGTYPFN